MTRTIVTVIAFAGGVAVGLLIADEYAKRKVTSSVDSALGAFGLGGGRIQTTVDNILPGLVG